MPTIKEVNDADKNASFQILVATHGTAVVSRKNIVGYCSYPEHRGWLTKTIANQHQCYLKQCSACTRIDSPYWDVREAEVKSRQKAKKARQESKLDKNLPLENQILDYLRSEVKRLKFKISILRVQLLPKKNNLCVIYYRSESAYDNSGQYARLCSNAFKKFGICCTLRKEEKRVEADTPIQYQIMAFAQKGLDCAKNHNKDINAELVRVQYINKGTGAYCLEYIADSDWCAHDLQEICENIYKQFNIPCSLKKITPKQAKEALNPQSKKPEAVNQTSDETQNPTVVLTKENEKLASVKTEPEKESDNKQGNFLKITITIFLIVMFLFFIIWGFFFR